MKTPIHILPCKTDSPCLNCQKREVGCHSTCADYKRFKNLAEHNKELLVNSKKSLV